MLNYVFSASALNVGGYKMLQDFNFSSLTAEAGVGGATPGMTFWFKGRLFQIVQNRSGGDLAVGDVVGLYMANSARVGALQTGSTAAVLKTDDTLDSGLAGSSDYPGFVNTTAGAFATTDTVETHPIIANDSTASNSLITIAQADRSLGPVNGTAILNADALSTTPDNTYKYDVFCPWEVVKAQQNAVTTAWPQGVVISTVITNAYFGVIQLKGVGLAKCLGTAIVAGDVLAVANGTAGVLEEWLPTTTAATLTQLLQGLTVCARALGAYSNAGPGLRSVYLTMPHAIHPQPTF